MKKKLDPAIEDYLTEFGLSEREIALYIALLQTGPNTIMNLSRETGIKRSTTHNNVEELIKKGLVSQTNYGERRMVVAENPDKLKLLLDQKKYQVEKLGEQLDPVVSQIEKLVPSNLDDSTVEVKYLEGFEGVRSVYIEAAKSNEIRSYVNAEKIVSVFPENLKVFSESIRENEVEIWEILEKSDTSLDYVKNNTMDKFHYKFFPKKWNITLFDYMIFNGKIVIITMVNDDTPRAVVIQDPAAYKNAKVMFEMMWELLPDTVE